jgi:hypothetical protein
MIAAQHFQHSGVRREAANHSKPLGLCCALALGAALAANAGAAVIEISGGSYGPPGPSNGAEIDYILIEAGATVNGDVANEATGIISGDAGHAGIGIYDGSTVTGAVENQAGGSLGASDLDNYAIEVRDSTIAGGLRNDGTLASADTAVVIDLSGSGALSGGIANTGSITSRDGSGIDFYGTELSGDLSNTGSITSDQTGIALYVDGDMDYGGSLDGAIRNSGSIASAGNAGIRVYAGALSGGLVNTGTISAASDDGIALEIGAISNGLSNGGTIVSGYDGIHVLGESLDGGFSNAGDIASSAGSGVVFSLQRLSGGITSSGAIHAGDRDGLSLDVAQLSGDIVNTGSIAAGQGNGVLIGSGSIVAGEIRNGVGGQIVAGAGIVVAGDAEVGGGLFNDGGIDAGVAVEVSEDAVSGTVGNTGTLRGDLFIAGSNAAGAGIDLTNDGSIDLGMPAVYRSLISGDFTQTASGSLAFTVLSFADYADLPPLTVLGSVDLAGELLLGFDAGFSFAPFEGMTLIGVGGARTGAFANYADNALVSSFGGRRGVYIDYTDDGDIALYTTPLPPTWLLIGLGLFAWRRLARRHG